MFVSPALSVSVNIHGYLRSTSSNMNAIDLSLRCNLLRWTLSCLRHIHYRLILPSRKWRWSCSSCLALSWANRSSACFDSHGLFLNLRISHCYQNWQYGPWRIVDQDHMLKTFLMRECARRPSSPSLTSSASTTEAKEPFCLTGLILVFLRPFPIESVMCLFGS